MQTMGDTLAHQVATVNLKEGRQISTGRKIVPETFLTFESP